MKKSSKNSLRNFQNYSESRFKPETAIKRSLKQYLSLKGWFVFHILQGLGSYPGIPDLIAVKNGQTLFIEVKTHNGRQSKKQEEFQKALEDHGGKYLLIRDLDELIKQGL